MCRRGRRGQRPASNRTRSIRRRARPGARSKPMRWSRSPRRISTEAARLARASTADHYQVVVHVDEKSLRGGVGRADLPIDTVKRLTCDGSVVTVVEDERGTPLDVGRKQRTVSTPLKRALYSRDRGCSFPGCERKRYLDAHHLKHWAERRRHEPREPDVALHAPSPLPARGRLPHRARSRRRASLSACRRAHDSAFRLSRRGLHRRRRKNPSAEVREPAAIYRLTSVLC